MGYNSNVYKEAADRLFQKRLQAEKEADFRRDEIYEKLPRAKELEKGIASGGIRAARAVIGGGDVAAELEKLRVENLKMQNDLRELLISNGYGENALEPDYNCKKCNDTGYYDENGRTLVCTCLKQTLADCACEELNKYAPLSLSTFDAFRVDFYSESADSNGIVPRVHMDKVAKYCKNYAYNFTPSVNSLLMYGATGLGKTHLSLSIANEVIKRGYGVIYVSAPSLVQQLDKQMFSREKDDTLINMIIDCDLLIIDDLGTEFHSQLSVSNLYNIINSRMLAHKPMIISTNLNMAELEKMYSARLVSRISGESQKLNFVGDDIRIAKKKIH